LHGKNVAVVGTDASAIQFVPQIAPRAGKLSLFQRATALDCAARGFSHRSQVAAALPSFPAHHAGVSAMHFLAAGVSRSRLSRQSLCSRKGDGNCHTSSREANQRPQLRAALKPNYELGCKRVLVSDDYYPSLTRRVVELVIDAIAEVREHGIVTADGVERPVHVLVIGTGFRATEPLIGVQLVGRGGVEIHDAWRERMSAYLGVTVSGFSSLFLLLGPTTGLGHNSVVLMIEAQVRYVMSCLALVKRGQRRVLDV
jgi:cation diffusion facilitator CzcD-associated flavoprotein CzcO